MQLSSIDTHLVVALHALLTERSVTRAARRVGVTQPTMSHALARLRVCFEDPLLVAVGRTMAPTPAALALMEPVANAIAGLERVFLARRGFDPRRDARTFVLAATDNLELIVLPPLARLLAREAPNVDLRCRALSSSWGAELLRGELHLKLGRLGAAPAGVVSERLVRESFVCLVRRGHPALRGHAKSLSVKAYVGCAHLLVAPHGGEAGSVDVALSARGLKRRIAMTLPHFLVAPFVVASSDLVLTAPSRVAAALGSRLGLVSVPCPVAVAGYALAMAWAAHTETDTALAWLREAVRRALGEAA